MATETKAKIHKLKIDGKTRSFEIDDWNNFYDLHYGSNEKVIEELKKDGMNAQCIAWGIVEFSEGVASKVKSIVEDVSETIEEPQKPKKKFTGTKLVADVGGDEEEKEEEKPSKTKKKASAKKNSTKEEEEKAPEEEKDTEEKEES